MGTLDNGSFSRATEGSGHRLAGRQAIWRMLDTTIPAEGPLSTLAQLIAAEERLDELEARGTAGAEYEVLRGQVIDYVKATPELAQAPWLRCGGTVYDMLSEGRPPGRL